MGDGGVFWESFPIPHPYVVPVMEKGPRFEAGLSELQFRVLVESLRAEAMAKKRGVVILKDGQSTIDYVRKGKPRVSEDERTGRPVEVVEKTGKIHLDIARPGGLDIRVTCCEERVLPLEDIYSLGEYRRNAFQRKKKRWAFKFMLMEVDLTEVSDNQGGKQFEVEIEVIDRAFLLQ